MSRGTDLVYGRQGGRIVAGITVRDDRPCVVCREPMVVGQKVRHFACCAKFVESPKEPCNPHADPTTKKTVCAYCWRVFP